MKRSTTGAGKAYVRRKVGGVGRDELGEVLSVDPRDQTARVRWLRQNRVGEYKLSELERVRPSRSG
jgi:hypothetical protein